MKLLDILNFFLIINAMVKQYETIVRDYFDLIQYDIRQFPQLASSAAPSKPTTLECADKSDLGFASLGSSDNKVLSTT